MRYDYDWHAMPCGSTLATRFISRRSTLSANKTLTSKSAIVRIDGRSYYFFFYTQFVITHRYNIFKRVDTLLARVTQKKTVKLGATFLPKYKRVLVKHPQRVLNKPGKKKKKVATPVDDLLDSQCSLTFLDSQGRFSNSQTVCTSSYARILHS